MAKFAGGKIYCNSVHASNNRLRCGVDVADIRAVGGGRLAEDLVADTNIIVARGKAVPGAGADKDIAGASMGMEFVVGSPADTSIIIARGKEVPGGDADKCIAIAGGEAAPWPDYQRLC